MPHESRPEFQKRQQEHRGRSALPPGLRNLGSSWQSLERGLGSIEADFLNGEIVRLGRLHGIATPYNAVLQEVANHMVAHQEKPGHYTVPDLERLAQARVAA